MAPTSDERREVAERLREDASCSESSPREVVETYLGIEYDGEDVFEESYKSDSLLHLADLIDPTCELVGTESIESPCGPVTYIYSHELSCGHTVETYWEDPPYYCPECGARVASGDGLD